MFKANSRLFRALTGFPYVPPLLRSALIQQQLGKQAVAAICGLGVLALCIGCGAGGPVSSTNNPQVAVYTYNARSAGSVKVEFGTTTAYGFETSPQIAPSGGAPVRILVAGMLGNTTYHMRAVATYTDGTTDTDRDQVFTTASYNLDSKLPQITATTSPGQTPQPGIEMIDALQTPTAPLIATNLSGQVIWAYVPSPSIPSPALVQAPKLLSNGDFLFVIGPSSSLVLTTPSTIPTGTPEVIREINLAGDTVKEISIATLNQELSHANYNLTLLTFHHDVTVLPNGHWLVLANIIKSVVLTGQTTPTQVLGDVVIDLDTNLNPVWVWNEFDHLDVNRRGWEFPDWTHTNALIYSQDDGNILVSMRAQNWIVKVDYNNGAGAGDVIWRLGEGGDFTLQGGVDPTDWFYAQHGPSFTTTNTTGIFGLTVMDNGDDRMYPNGPADVVCGTNGSAACYSTVPVFQINESAKTATFIFHQVLPGSLFNSFGGNSETLDNEDIEYDLCGLAGTTPNSQISEVTADNQNPQQIWTLQVNTTNAYRGFRLPSLYPGVQW